MNVNVRAMTSRLSSILLLTVTTAGTLGCNAHPDSNLHSHVADLRLTYHDADSIGSLDADASAPPADLADYRRANAPATLQTVAVIRHPIH